MEETSGSNVSHLPEAKDKYNSGQESHNARGEDEELVVAEVGGLLELIHDLEAEGEAHDEEAPKYEEDEDTEDVDDLIEGEVPHGLVGRYSWQQKFWCQPFSLISSRDLFCGFMLN